MTETKKKKHDTEDPFANLSETLRSNVINHISHSVEEVDKPMSNSNPFEIEYSELLQEPLEVNLAEVQEPHEIHRLDTQINARIQTSDAKNKSSRYDESTFMGAFPDTGAQRSVCGRNQAIAYDKMHPGPLRAHDSSTQFKFEEQLATSTGIVSIKLPIHNNTHVDLHVDVIDLDIPLIIGLDVLKSKRLLVNYIDNNLHFCNKNIKQPLTYKFRHVIYEWDIRELFFTRQELTRLHLHFMHPSSRSLFDLIARSDPTKATPSIGQLIESISNACATCQ